MIDYTNPLYNPFINPYLTPQGQQAAQPRQEVVRVNGENGARAFSIGPNSSALLLDESGTLVWLVTTDGAGYKTVTAFDIAPHQEARAPDIASLETRITRLEEMIADGTAEHPAAVKQNAEQPGGGQPRTDQGNRR